eukprot:6926891-Pyramimonas_sp.AAC.1
MDPEEDRGGRAEADSLEARGSQLANNDASDLEYEVWRLRLDRVPASTNDGERDGDGGGGSADAASAKKHNRRTKGREA